MTRDEALAELVKHVELAPNADMVSHRGYFFSVEGFKAAGGLVGRWVENEAHRKAVEDHLILDPFGSKR